LKEHLHNISKIKPQKESQNSRNQGFHNYFWMMIEGSGAGAGSGSIPQTNRFGSWRPKHIWIRWIRIRNTDGIYLIYPGTGYATYCTVRYRLLMVKFGNCAGGIEVKEETLFSSSFIYFQ
jgi:hypothetical protein